MPSGVLCAAIGLVDCTQLDDHPWSGNALEEVGAAGGSVLSGTMDGTIV